MKPGVPWSVKGVEPELREVAKTAARRSGMTLGEWLNSAINEQADGAPPEQGEPAARPPRSSLISTHPIERAATKLEDIAQQLSRLALRETDTSYQGNEQKLENSVTFAKVMSRVEANEKQTVEAFTAVNDRLATLSRQFTRAQGPKVEESPSYQALEKAVRNIIDHLEISDKRTRENMKALQERMGELATREPSEQDLRQAPAFSQLESRLTDLARRLEQPAADPNIVETFRRELQSLEGRIDTVRETAETLAHKAQTQAVQAAQSELHTIEGRILGLLNEAQKSIGSQTVDPVDIQRFRGEIEQLHGRIDETSKGAASGQDVNALRAAVEQLSTRVAQGSDMRPFAEIERRMSDFDERLSHSVQVSGSSASAAVAHKLAEVDERMGRAEHQLSHLETIEKAITQLYDSLEQNRKYSHDVAHDAANMVAQQVMGQTSQAPLSLANSPEIQALQQGLEAVRQASHDADQRNQDTLEAVHETLEQIVTKLAELETAAIGQRVAEAAALSPAPISEPQKPVAPELDEGISQIAQTPLPSAEELFKAEPASENFMDPVFASAGNPFSDDTKNTAESSVTTPELHADLAIDDFVAAARRAHQAANEQKSALSGLVPKPTSRAKDAARANGGFKFPFLSRGEKTTSLPGSAPAKKRASITPANNNDIARSRKGLIGIGLVVLIVAAFTTTNIYSRKHRAPAPEPTKVEQSAAPAQSENAAPQKPTVPAPAANATPPAAAAPVPQPEPAQLVQPDTQQKTDAATPQAGGSIAASESDPILTGAVTQAKPSVPPSSAGSVVPELAVGPAKLRDAAQGGDANAQFIIATHYLNGDTVPVDFAKAAYWYGKAAASGLAPAQYRLATLYERGKGIDKNLSAALSWYERAASLGNVKAMHNAAVIAAGSEAGQPDYTRAFKWFSLAANNGLKDSQFNLAVLIERGLGTKADPAEALFWYMAAAAQDDADAKARVAAISKSLSPSTLDAVKLRLKNWTPLKAPDAANVVAVNDARWNPGNVAQSSLPNLNDQAKTLLDKMGYRVGTQDGTLDTKTANAIKLFQIQQGMKVTGKVTPELISAMQSKAG